MGIRHRWRNIVSCLGTSRIRPEGRGIRPLLPRRHMLAPALKGKNREVYLQCCGILWDFIRHLNDVNLSRKVIWVRPWNCGCLVTWFCYQLIAKPGNKSATVPWPDPYGITETKRNLQENFDVSTGVADGLAQLGVYCLLRCSFYSRSEGISPQSM